MNTRRIIISALWTLACWAAAPFILPVNKPLPEITRTTTPGPVERPIYIGVIGPLSGSNEQAGQGQLNAVRLAVDEANATGGINGRPLEVVFADDAGNPDAARAGVTRLINLGAVAILGAINSSCTLAIMDTCYVHNVPLLTSSSTASRITALGNEWVFRCIESDASRMGDLAEYLIEELKLKRIGILYEDDDFGRGLRDDLSRSLTKYGLEIAFTQSFHRDQRDFSAALNEASRKDIQAIGLFGITHDNIFIAEQVRRMGLSFQLFSPDVNEQYIAQGVEGVEGLVATDSYYLLTGKQALQEFESRYTSRFNGSVGPHAGRAYDAARILIQALRRASSPSSRALRNTISATDNFYGLTGDFSFRSNGDVAKKTHIITIHNNAFLPAQELATRKTFRRWLMYLVPSLLVVFLIVHWLVSRTRRAVQNKLRRRALLEFHPIRVNPYIVGNPIREKEMFFGREDDFRFIVKNVGRHGSGVCIVLCGERRSGKTSILYQVLNGRLGDTYLPLLIDLQLYGNTADSENFFTRMIQDISEHLRKLKLPSPPAQWIGRQGLETLLTELINTNPSQKIILLLDEYEILETLIDQNILHPSAVDFLSAMLDRYATLSYVLTGSTRLEDRKKPYWQNLIAKSLYRRISFLTKNDTLRLIEEPLRGIVYYEEGIPEKIYRYTAGQPFYTQAVCMNIVDHLNEVQHNLVTAADLEAVIAQLVENPLPQMLYFWENFKQEEKLVLSLLAEALNTVDQDGWMDGIQLLQYARQQKLPAVIEAEIVHTTLEALFTCEVLWKKANQFQYRMDLLREWVRRDHSPWQIIGENNHR